MPEEREMITKTGSQKAVVATAPNLTAAILVLVYAACGYLGIGPTPDGDEIQAAIGLMVLAAISGRLTWYVPNALTKRRETEAERVARIKHDLDNPEN